MITISVREKNFHDHSAPSIAICIVDLIWSCDQEKPTRLDNTCEREATTTFCFFGALLLFDGKIFCQNPLRTFSNSEKIVLSFFRQNVGSENK